MAALRELYLLVICIVAVSSRSVDTKTTCSAPAAYLGEPGSLTCHFRVNVTAKGLSFSVRYADRHDFDYNRDTILDCDWIDGKQMCSTIREGFTYDNRVSNVLTLIIPNVTVEHHGLYSCQFFQEGPGDVQSCSLTVLERGEPRPSLNLAVLPDEQQAPHNEETGRNNTQVQTRELNLLPIIIPAVVGPVVVIMVIITIVCMCKRKKTTVRKYQAGDVVGEIKDLMELGRSPLHKVPDKQKRKSCDWKFKRNIRQ